MPSCRVASFSTTALLALAASACSSSSASTAPTEDAASHDTGAAKEKDAGHDSSKPPHDAGHPKTPEAAPPADVGGPVDAGGPTDAGKPPPPTGTMTTSTTALTFAMHHLWLGDSLANTQFTTPPPPNDVWASFGYNIDGLITNESSTDVCTLNTAAHATTAVQLDGNEGIDNSFGKNVVGTVLANAIPMLSQTISASITTGSFTILLHTVGLSPSPTQSNMGLTGELFSASSYAGAPPVTDAGSFLTTDTWPVLSTSLLGPSLDAGARAVFTDAYVTNGLWVSGSPVDLTLVLMLQNQPLILDIHEAILTFQHTVDDAGQDHATTGAISGVLVASEFLAEVAIVAAQQRYCEEESLLLNYIAASADIMHDGTNVKGMPCDAISIGLEFDADAVADPTQVIEVPDASGPVPSCDAGDGG